MERTITIILLRRGVNGNILATEIFNDSGSLNSEIYSTGNYYVLVDDSFYTEDYTFTRLILLLRVLERRRVMMDFLLQIRLLLAQQ